MKLVEWMLPVEEHWYPRETFLQRCRRMGVFLAARYLRNSGTELRDALAILRYSRIGRVWQLAPYDWRPL